MNLDTAFGVVGSVAQAAVIALLFYRHAWRRFPVFCMYSISTLLAGGGFLAIQRCSPKVYLTVYVVYTILDLLLEFGVMLELVWSALRPVRRSVPRFNFFWVALAQIAAAAAIWPFAIIRGFGDFSYEFRFLMHMQQTILFLRMLIFLLLAGFSQLLSISWRDRELQIATGFGFYAFVGLAVAMLHASLSEWSLYSLSNQVLVASSIFSILYWVVCFAQKEPARREFTPQMQNLLLAMAGNARATRIAVGDPTLRRRGRSGE